MDWLPTITASCHTKRSTLKAPDRKWDSKSPEFHVFGRHRVLPTRWGFSISLMFLTFIVFSGIIWFQLDVLTYDPCFWGRGGKLNSIHLNSEGLDFPKKSFDPGWKVNPTIPSSTFGTLQKTPMGHQTPRLRGTATTQLEPPKNN